MLKTLTDGERDILAEQNREAQEGLCAACGESFQREDWYGQLVCDLETEDGRTVPMEKCCPDCIDGYFTDDTCAHVTADGSMELC